MNDVIELAEKRIRAVKVGILSMQKEISELETFLKTYRRLENDRMSGRDEKNSSNEQDKEGSLKNKGPPDVDAPTGSILEQLAQDSA